VSQHGQRLFGKVALITGGSRGIGRAIAAAYIEEGGKVFICGRAASDVDRAVEEIRRGGGEISGVAGDVSEPDDVQRIVATAVERFGTVDVLVNNASLLGPRMPIADYPYESWRAVMRANVDGPFLVTQRVLKTMIPCRSGSVINVTSGVGRVGKPHWGAYGPSKFALEGFTQMLAEEVKEYGIRVNALNPGATRTTMRAAAYPDEDPQTLPRPEEIMESFIYLASDESLDVTGRSLDADRQGQP
jgi:NAD(P)-dependent dehydrogenase (short-subunit alcohol dehydrogenase family)